MDTEKDKKRRDEFNRTASGHWNADTPYEDTATRSELMRLRGYQLIDGTWVP